MDTKLYIDFNILNFELSMNASIQTFRSIVEILVTRIQTGLTLSDIENALFFIIFVRFLILAMRYNLKTSFYITCIGLFAGYLWYKHLIDIILLYRNVLLRVPFLSALGENAIEMQSKTSLFTLKEGSLKVYESLGSGVTQMGGYATQKDIDFATSEKEVVYYIDPISMIVSNLDDTYRSKIWPLYYQVYNEIIPKIFSICAKFWTQMSGIVAYVFITRIGKKYCPYLVRWHWTFLIVLGFVEQSLVAFVYRMVYFQTYILIPKAAIFNNSLGLIAEINVLNFLICLTLFAHIGFIIFGLFHAIWGQYFYFPFFVENTELHIGPRPRNSIYSGGQTAWQYPDEKNINRFFPTLWFGWFGYGSSMNNRNYYYKKKITRKTIKRFIKKFFKRIKKIFRR